MNTHPRSVRKLFPRFLLLLALLVGLGLLTSTMAPAAHAATTLTVTDCSSDSQVQADVSTANSDNNGDTITFACSGDIKLSSTLTISGSMTIDGSGQSVTLDGNNSVQVMSVNRGVSLTLNALTIAHGFGFKCDCGGIYNGGGTVSITGSTFAYNALQYGGAGFGQTSGTVNISNSIFSNNAEGILSQGGMVNITNTTFTNNYNGIWSQTDTLNISNSTFANNNANGIDGSGLFNDGGTVSITNSTFANNSAPQGGGLFNDGGTVSIANSTFADNSADQAGGIYDGFSNDGGTVSLSGSIVANNTGGNCATFNGATITSTGYNLESGTDCGFTGTGDLQNTDPKLDLNGLQNNGGPTQTIALQQGSPAIDQIPAASCPKTDQRGDARPDDSETSCDIGAYESNYQDNDLALTDVPANITVNATSPQGAVVTYTPPTVVDEDNPLPPVNCTPASGSTFAIGQTIVTCTVSDSDDSNSPVSATFTVTVNPALTVSVSSVNATEGSAFSGVVATGTAYGSSNPLTATITWGDGNTSTVSVTPNPDGSFSVPGNHTYAEEGSYALSVSVKDSGSLSASGNGTAQVADAALTLTHFVAGPVGHHSAGVGATFTDADPNGSVSDYTATINWGDGNTSTVKVIENPFGQGFVLAGLHSYVKTGTYSVTLTVSDSGGSQVTKTVSITVK